MMLGAVYLYTKRAARGNAAFEHALALDRNLAQAHGWIGTGKLHVLRPEETEAHIVEALRLSPRDTSVYSWIYMAGLGKNQLGLWDHAVAWFERAIETNRSIAHPYFALGGTLVRLGQLSEARSAVVAGLALNPSFTIARYRANWTAANDEPMFLAWLERMIEAMRVAGVPEA